jgi:hypothetical protein
MIDRWALVRAGVVVDIVLGDENLPQLLLGQYDAVVAVSEPLLRAVREGWSYTAGVFTEPVLTLAEAKRRKVASIWTEAMPRVVQIYSELDTRGAIEPLTDLWLSIAPAARQPNANWQAFLDLANAVRTALVEVRNATTVAEVVAVVVNWP